MATHFTVPLFARIHRWPLLLVAVLCAGMAMGNSDSSCALDKEEPKPLDERLSGSWRDVPSGAINPTDILDIQAGDTGTLVRMRHNRGNTWNSSTNTITIDGVVYIQQSGTGLSGTFVAPAGGGQPSRTLTLDGTAGTYTLRWDYTYPVRESGTFALAGSDEVVLTRPEVGGAWTDDERTTLEVWSNGTVRWHYLVQSGPVLFLRDEYFFKGSAGLTGGWWYNSSNTRFYSFSDSGILTEVIEKSEGTTPIWRQTNSYVYRNFPTGSTGQFEVGQRLIGEYQISGENEDELTLTADRPLTQRRYGIDVGNTTLSLGGPNGWETYSRMSGTEGLTGTWSGGGITWTFDETLGTYSQSIGGDVVESGMFEPNSPGSALLNFRRQYRWFKKDE